MAFSNVCLLREYKHTHLSKVLVSNGFRDAAMKEAFAHKPIGDP